MGKARSSGDRTAGDVYRASLENSKATTNDDHKTDVETTAIDSTIDDSTFQLPSRSVNELPPIGGSGFGIPSSNDRIYEEEEDDELDLGILDEKEDENNNKENEDVSKQMKKEQDEPM